MTKTKPKEKQNPFLGLSRFKNPVLDFIKEGDIGVCGITVLDNFSCGISVILIQNCGIAVFLKPAVFGFVAFLWVL